MKPLREYLDELKQIEGYPIGADEDILALSDPPHYTACPNPYIQEFIAQYGRPYDEATDAYRREPFLGDVSEGKNDPIYNAHSYHTKVPHKAIMKYIEHYTNEGDIVLDGFCGTGMTGVAAQLLNRRAILSDLSPIATFIAYNYNTPVDVKEFEREARRILEEVEAECNWMYETQHVEEKPQGEGVQTDYLGKEEKQVGKINYTVWSDVFLCPYCKQEYVFWDVAVDHERGKVNSEYVCPFCQAEITKRESKRATVTEFDKAIQQEITQTKQIPVLINYTWKGKRYEKTPDKIDLDLIQKIHEAEIPYWFPTDKFPKGEKTWEPIRLGFTHLHHLYTKRSLWTLSAVFNKLRLSGNSNIAKKLKFTYEQIILGMSKLSRYSRHHYSQVNRYLPGTLYIGSQISEVSLPYIISGKMKRLVKVFQLLQDISLSKCCVANQSATKLYSVPGISVDYIFTDPPFGDNLMYSELNFLWESWLKVFTNTTSEAIINKKQEKGLSEYRQLMMAAFKEYYRVLKPNRWITVEFHNTKSSVWNAIQEGMLKAGFIIAQVAVLNKQQGSFNQVTAAGAVKNDLVISAYKPPQDFEERFLSRAGANLEQEFLQQFLANLPVRPLLERTEKMLYSKMLAYYIQKGYAVRYDAKTFYTLLRNHFIEEDGYWFNPEQSDAYREYKKRMKLEGIDDIKNGALMLMVVDEASALAWLFQFLDEPKSFSDISTAFNKVSQIQGDEVPELAALLEDNFVKDEGRYRRPEFDSERNSLSDRRDRALLKTFENLLEEARSAKKKIKSIRKEAVLRGFEHCYKAERFDDILTLANRLDHALLDASTELSEFVEIARIKVEGVH